jgi:hypothetical protein
MTDNEIKFLEDFTGYHFRGYFTPELLNSGKVEFKHGDMFSITGADEFTELRFGHLYVRNGMIVRFGFEYVCGEGFRIVADYPCDTVRLGHYLDNEGKQQKLKKEMRVPIGLITEGNSVNLLHHIIKELNKD